MTVSSLEIAADRRAVTRAEKLAHLACVQRTERGPTPGQGKAATGIGASFLTIVQAYGFRGAIKEFFFLPAKADDCNPGTVAGILNTSSKFEPARPGDAYGGMACTLALAPPEGRETRIKEAFSCGRPALPGTGNTAPTRGLSKRDGSFTATVAERFQVQNGSSMLITSGAGRG